MPRTTKFSFIVPGAPEEVAQRLTAARRFRLMPFQGTVLIPKDRPLAGRVGEDRFALALNKRDWLTLMQAVAKGALQETPEGTRVEGEAGMPSWVTWGLRGVSVLSFISLVVGAYLLVTAAGGEGVGAAVLASGAMMLALVLGIGLNVRNADDQIPELISSLERAAWPARAATQEEAVSAPQAVDERRLRARAAARQKQG